MAAGVCMNALILQKIFTIYEKNLAFIGLVFHPYSNSKQGSIILLCWFTFCVFIAGMVPGIS